MVSVFLIVAIVGVSFPEVFGRAVNISGTWFLPQEGFPMFYRYFNEKLTWNEAEAVCGFHHADLLSVQTNTQMDAARAYLKEIDVTDNVWIGLRRESPEKAFFWTNGEKLLDDGYWVEPTPKTNEKLCAAIDPVSDFRWNSFYCRGPQIASFVCELPVPEWAKKDDGCMITSLPSLTVTLMPEIGVVQLFSDCGLDGTRRIACKGGVIREEIIKRLSCDVDAFASTIFGKTTTEAVKDVNMQLNTFQNGEDSNRFGTTQTFKTWNTYTPLTRHRRSDNLSPPDTVVALTVPGTKSPQEEIKTEEVTSTQVTPTQSKGEVLNFPSHLFPHSPYLAAERNAPGTKVPPPMTTPKTIEKTQNPKDSKESTSTEAFHEKTTTSIPTIKNVTSSTVTKINNDTNKMPVQEQPNVNSTSVKDTLTKKNIKDIPILIITDEKVNDALILNSSTPTSENPEIVVMIENEDLSEPYIVPLSEDIAVNNPSLSPLEIMVEVEKITTPQPSDKTDKTTSSIEKTPVKKPDGVPPLKIGEKLTQNQNQTSAKNSKIIRSLNLTSSSSKVTMSSVTEVEHNTEKLVTVIEDEKKVESLEVPQKPNRGRLLTRSNHLSFYPYFLNRVLG